MNDEEEFDYDALEEMDAENDEKEEDVVEEVAIRTYDGLNENPFADMMANESGIHKWRGDHKKKKGYGSENFGFVPEEIKQTKPNDEGKIQTYLRGTTYFDAGMKKEMIFPFSALHSQLKVLCGIPKEDVRKTPASIELYNKLIGRFIYIKYGGKLPNPNKKGQFFHTCYVQEKTE